MVSAIIPTYNRARVVCEAIESVLRQSYREVEIIVVDDGSTDDTQARLAHYGNRICVVTQSNSGPAAARNRGVAASSGELIAFLDSDDLWLPTKIERQVNLLAKIGPSVPCCLSNITMQWSTGERTSFDIAALDPPISEGIWLNVDEVLVTRFVLFNQGVMIRRDVLERCGGFDESLWLLEDTELSLRLSLEGPWAFIREPLVVWRETKAGSLYQQAKNNEMDSRKPLVQILEKHLARVQQGDHHRRLQKYASGELKRARRQLSAARKSLTAPRVQSAIGTILQRIERYRRGVFVRSPFFPKMKVAPCNFPGI
jgi:glycosyltransferase involved in cell wall biosynthesis